MSKTDRLAKFLAMSALLLAITACGQEPGERTVSGAGIGAGVGAIGGALTGGCVGCGALIGGVVGGAAGGLTSPNQIDLGKPVWK